MTAQFRVTSGCPDFPFGYPGLVCYFETRPDSTDPVQAGTRDDLRAAVRRAIASETDLWAVWPGQYRSDLFWIDNPSKLAEAIKA